MIGELTPSTFYATVYNSTEKLDCGNPFEKQGFHVPWNQLVLLGTDIYFTLKNSILTAVTITLGSDCAPESIRLYSNGTLLSEHHGETGKCITDKTITLTTDCDGEEFVLKVDSSFTDVNIESIRLFGMEKELALFPTPKDMRLTGRVVPLTEVDFITDASLGKNEYILNVSDEGITVRASDALGFTMARSRIEALKTDDGIFEATISDSPFASFRGVHLYLPAEEDMPFAKNLVQYMLAPMGYNHIILEICGAMEFTSHPEINEKYLEAQRNLELGIWPKLPHGSVANGTIVKKSVVSDFCQFCRSLGVEVIPEIQSLGHVQFMTLAHPEIAEIPEDKPDIDLTDERLADVPPEDFYAHSFCPGNKRSYEILFDLMDEIIDTVRPEKYVHMGHDEVYQIGVCPICKKVDPAELYLADVLKLHDYLAKKGYTMMLWADMLQSASAYKTVSAIERIPKDIVLLDFIWYFHLDENIEENLTRHGFNVIFGNMYSSHFPRYEERIRGNNISGGQLSAWVSTNEKKLQREGKLYDFIYTSEMLWNEKYLSECRPAYDRIIRSFLPKLRASVQGKHLAIGEETEVSLDSPINLKAEPVNFTHTLTTLIPRLPWAELIEVGSYTVTYSDSTVEAVALENGNHVYYAGTRQNAPLKDAYYRHNGYVGTWTTDEVLANGKTYYRYSWTNPNPKKEIASITLNASYPIEVLSITLQ